MDTFGMNQDRLARGLPIAGFRSPNPRYSPGAHNSMSTTHYSSKLNSDQYKKQIGKESKEIKHASAAAHKLSDHADSLKHTIDNHVALAKHHTAAADAHAKLAHHFDNLSNQHGGKQIGRAHV